MATRTDGSVAGDLRAGGPRASVPDLDAFVREILNRHPAVGLALGVVADGHLVSFSGRGFADIASRTPITEDTVFRIASITKTFTAIAVMQLWERGLVDLDAPATEYLRAYDLIPARAGWRPATIRHLLTHTAGIREVLHPWGLLRMRDLGETVKRGQRVPSLAEFYAGALRIDAEPGTRFMYTDHGFATLGQIVEDVTATSLADQMREHIFEPLGMTRTVLGRPGDFVGVATGYELRAHGAEPVTDYELITVGGGGVSSTPADMARYLVALTGRAANEHGQVLRPETLAMMCAPQYRPDRRVPGVGFAFFRGDLGGHPTIEHDGILPGFDAQILAAPDDGIAVMAFANGAKRGMHWLAPEVSSLLRRSLMVPEAAIRADVPRHPEIWGELCGWYRFSAHPSDPARLALGPGAEVLIRGGELTLRALSPIPALYRGSVLHPDDEEDPYVFRIEAPWFGTTRVVFGRAPGGEVTAFHLEAAPMSFERRPAATNPRRWGTAALGAAAVTVGAAAVRRRRACSEEAPR
jgi:CubicO group peptidase (beta-lactamase class C family)